MSQNNFLSSMKAASQRFAATVADTGAKTMLKTDVAFLERDIKARKQTFGIEIYDILQSNSGDDTSAEIQKAFEACQMDIQHLEAKVNSKRDEMVAIDTSSGTGATGGQSSSGAGHMDDAETPGIPSTP